MGWASRHIEKLKAGETVQFRPKGHSMSGKIESGQLCTVEPFGSSAYDWPAVGEIVLCKVRGREYLHLISAVQGGDRYQISNNKGHINGWISSSAIFGRCTKVEP